MTSRFITLEGGEGAGKSTQIRLLEHALSARGHDVVTTREPGGSPGAEEIRKLLVQGEPERWDPLVETLLLFAARADHVANTIRPALARGAIVLCDRFTDSTYAYQGAGRGLGQDIIRRIESVAVPDLKPELTLILDVPAETGLRRAVARRGTDSRFEGFDLAFHERLCEAFREMARLDPHRCLLIDASQPEKDVAAAIRQAVEARCGF